MAEAEGEPVGLPSNLKSVLMCGICFGTLVEPVSPSCCDHVFCKEHLEHWTKASSRGQDGGTCPVCRQPTWAVRQGGAAKMAQDVLDCFRFPCPKAGCERLVFRAELPRHLDLHDRVDAYKKKVSEEVAARAEKRPRVRA